MNIQRVCSVPNNNNLHSLRPYARQAGSIYIVRRSWWITCSSWFRRQARARFTVYLTDKVNTICSNQDINAMYRLFHESYDYQRWWTPELVPHAQVVALTRQDKTYIRDICAGRITLSDPRLDSVYHKLSTGLQALPEWPSVSAFVRTSRGSGKRGKTPRPCLTAYDVLTYLTSNTWFWQNEWEHMHRSTAVVLIPWNTNITPHNEFRLFVWNRNVVALSPSYCYDIHVYSGNELRCIYQALQRVSFLDSICFQNWTADVWLDWNTHTMHLIEANPYGAHSGCGSALFDWEADQSQMSGEHKIPLLRLYTP